MKYKKERIPHFPEGTVLFIRNLAFEAEEEELGAMLFIIYLVIYLLLQFTKHE